jgi:hypothetical protein
MRKHRYLVTRQEGLKGITQAVLVEADTTDAIETCEDLLDEIRDCITIAYKRGGTSFREEIDYACGDFNIGDLLGLQDESYQKIWEVSSLIKNVRLMSLDIEANQSWNYDTVLQHDLEKDAYESSS